MRLLESMDEALAEMETRREIMDELDRERTKAVMDHEERVRELEDMESTISGEISRLDNAIVAVQEWIENREEAEQAESDATDAEDIDFN